MGVAQCRALFLLVTNTNSLRGDKYFETDTWQRCTFKFHVYTLQLSSNPNERLHRGAAARSQTAGPLQPRLGSSPCALCCAGTQSLRRCWHWLSLTRRLKSDTSGMSPPHVAARSLNSISQTGRLRLHMCVLADSTSCCIAVHHTVARSPLCLHNPYVSNNTRPFVMFPLKEENKSFPSGTSWMCKCQGTHVFLSVALICTDTLVLWVV